MKKELVKAFTGMALACTVLGFGVQKANAQTTGGTGLTSLEPNKIYQYDLDGDGSVDKLQYKLKYYGENNDSYKLSFYVNKKNVWNKKEDSFGPMVSVDLCDINSKDNSLELLVKTEGCNDVLDYCEFFRYQDEKLNSVGKIAQEWSADRKPDGKITINRLGGNGFTVKGDGKVIVNVDTPFQLNQVGNYYTKVTYLMKNGTLQLAKTNLYTLEKWSREYVYTTKKNLTCYDSVGKNKKKVMTVKKGSKVTIKQVYLGTQSKKEGWGGSGYAKIQTSNGKVGWVQLKPCDTFSQPNTMLFKEVPLWG